MAFLFRAWGSAGWVWELGRDGPLFFHFLSYFYIIGFPGAFSWEGVVGRMDWQYPRLPKLRERLFFLFISG